MSKQKSITSHELNPTDVQLTCISEGDVYVALWGEQGWVLVVDVTSKTDWTGVIQEDWARSCPVTHANYDVCLVKDDAGDVRLVATRWWDGEMRVKKATAHGWTQAL